MEDCEYSGNSAMLSREMVKCAQAANGFDWITVCAVIAILAVLAFLYFKVRG